jgi:hypothetical protein
MKLISGSAGEMQGEHWKVVEGQDK